MALGPVPAGRMKPQLAASAAGIASRIACSPRPSAAARLAITGMIALAVATLLANSVISTTMATIASAISTSGTVSSGSSALPSQFASPLACIPAASARPPPNIMITPHGARSASLHLSSGHLFPFWSVPSGSRNSASEAMMAMVPSVQLSSGSKGATQRWLIHNAKVIAMIGTRRFSALDHGA